MILVNNQKVLIMGLVQFARKLYQAYRIRRWQRKGLTLGADCKFIGVPYFGSEPYLVTLGNRVAIAGDVVFITHDGGTHVFRHWPGFEQVIKFGRITIKDNCVLGERVIVLPGVTVGPDTVVAAGSVVTRSLPPGVVAAGNPAKPVMTTRQYAEWSRATAPVCDMEAYRADKRAYLSRLPLRGGPRPTPTEGSTGGSAPT